jgi:MATE family multidrug resistance protein
MNTERQRESLRWRHKPFPELVRLAWPITVSMLSYSVMTLVDTLFAGRLGATALGAVGFGGITTFTLLCFGIGILQSTKVLIAQAVGARRHDRILGYVGAALVVAGTLGAAIALGGQLVAWNLSLLADGSTSVRVAERYVAIRLVGSPLVLAAFAIREIRCALGDSRSPMRTALVANTLHVPLNAALIFWAGLGVTGAAVSTVIAQALEALLLARVQRRDGLGLRAWSRRDLVEIWQTGWPLGLERLFNVGAFSALVTLIARFGDTELAAHQIAHQVNLFAILPIVGIAEAAAVLAGQAVGANEDGLVRRVARIGVVAGAGYGVLCSSVYVVFGTRIARALTNDAAVIPVAVRLLGVAALCQAFVALYSVAAAVLRGAGDIRFATLAMCVIAWIVTPPLAVLFGSFFHLGAFGGWLALLVEWAIGTAVLWSRVELHGWLPAARRSRERIASAEREFLVAEPASG